MADARKLDFSKIKIDPSELVPFVVAADAIIQANERGFGMRIDHYDEIDGHPVFVDLPGPEAAAARRRMRRRIRRRMCDGR